jgi:hypothetical protein
MPEQIKIGTFEVFEQPYKVEYTFKNNGRFLNNESEVCIKSFQPAPHIEDIGWIKSSLEDSIRFHELNISISDREFQKHFADEMRSDEERGN